MAVFHHGMTVSVIAGKPQKYIEAWSLLPLLELTVDCGAIGHGERMLELVREFQDPFAVCSRKSNKRGELGPEKKWQNSSEG